MPVLTLDDLKELKSGKNRLLGLDLGEKTIGLALSDITWFISSPLEVIRRSTLENDYKALQKVINDFSVAGFVIGLPLNMNGSEGPQAQKARAFIDALLTVIDIPVYFWDERLSTVAVTRTLLEADLSRKKRAQVVDKMAATFILQGALDRFR
ncbi:Holliday junction resolvase RuvX [Candidatus Paracaedibacter symbiosus]|uniref:Holliday junction resolvase RuvX n=1 Tax=Candidatus Paracaedibacter symbiosus TaxID=244582 RepID=UPI00050963C6|nr:Holliday junction resolvase RuvX [Candidatus Paracaedibacter symbiosus]